MRLNNKGFVVSTLMYSLLIVFLFLIVGLITLLSNRKMILDKLKKDVKSDLNGMTKYDFYANGTTVYFNPVTGQACNDYVDTNSLNETKIGCLKWYAFNDNVNRNRLNLILDHNTTASVAYNSEGNNAEPKEANTELRNLVNNSKWQVTPRLITADEVAKIVGADRSDTIKWNARKEKKDGTDINIDTQNGWFYFDGSGTSYSDTNGWKKQTANATNKSRYSWLFNYLLSSCESYGCDISNGSSNGYWTSSKTVGHPAAMWMVYYQGNINFGDVRWTNQMGIRPVISISKRDLTN